MFYYDTQSCLLKCIRASVYKLLLDICINNNLLTPAELLVDLVVENSRTSLCSL